MPASTTQSPRVPTAGSQLWLQRLVNHHPGVIDDAIRSATSIPITATLDWRSPRAPGFAEFRDGEALAQLGVQLPLRPLSDFWPARGPVWDGLARASTGDVFLCEAKAHVPEMISGGTKAGGDSLARIRASLDAVRVAAATGNACVDWATGPFFQYANRLAFLHFLRVQNAVPAHLVFVYFLNAADVHGPSNRAAYEGATTIIERCLGVHGSGLLKYVHKVYVDVRDLTMPS